MAYELKIIGYDYSPIIYTIKNWKLLEDNKGVVTEVTNGNKKLDLKKNKYAKNLFEAIEEAKKETPLYLEQKNEGKSEEIIENDDGDSNSDSFPNIELLKLLYKTITDKIDLKKNDNLIIGKRRDVYHDSKDYYLRIQLIIGKMSFGNLVGSIRRVFTCEELKDFYDKIGETTSKTSQIKISIEIHSRFDVYEHGSDSKEKTLARAPWFLITMLTKGDLILNDYNVNEDPESVFDCLLLLKLRNHLLEANQKGFYHTYHTFEKNDDRVKGTIDFSRHIRLNMGQKNGKIAYSYREKTVDNYLNHLILAAYDHLKRKYPDMVVDNIDKDNDIYPVLDTLRNEISYPKYSNSYLIKKNSKPINHPFYTEFEELRRVCIDILRDEGVSIFGGEGEEVNGILYYIPDLWEQYLESKMTNLRFDTQKDIMILGNKVKTRPDYVFYTNDDSGEDSLPYLVLDAKFRDEWERAHNEEGIRFDYISGDLDKCIRDKNSLDSYAVGVIFPYQGKKDGLDFIHVHEFSPINTKEKNRFYTIPVNVPYIKCENGEEERYIEWKTRFDENITNVLNDDKDTGLKKCLEKEEAFFKANRRYDQIISELKEDISPEDAQVAIMEIMGIRDEKTRLTSELIKQFDIEKGGKALTSLTKSKYCRAVQCPKMLWMDYNMKDEGIDKSSEAVLRTGSMVGDLAMGYFGDFTEVPYGDKKLMCAETEKLMNEGTEVIAEASFVYDDCFCSVDILKKVEDGYELIEVKSSTHVKPIYIDDMAYQYYVLTKCGVPVVKVLNMHINNKYVRHGELDLKELFSLEDCTEKAIEKQDEIKNKIPEIKEYLKQSEEPEQALGVYCEDPYDCAYMEYCRRINGVVEPSLLSLAGMTKKKAYSLINDGIITFSDLMKHQSELPAKKVNLTEREMFQIKAELESKPTIIDKDGIKNFLNTLSYPLYHLDFETFQQAVPEFDDLRPFQAIPFQYSLHVQKTPCGEPEHFEFLAKENTDPRRNLAERLCHDIPGDVCVLAYNMSFEKGVINNLADTFPDLHDHLMCIHDNIKDLEVPFSKRYYYTRAMQGKSTIKMVLPAVCPGDPELDYHSLDGIHNGGEAMDAYPAMKEKTPEEIEVIRKQLLAYCRLDTLAMVKVLEKLYKAVE